MKIIWEIFLILNCLAGRMKSSGQSNLLTEAKGVLIIEMRVGKIQKL